MSVVPGPPRRRLVLIDEMSAGRVKQRFYFIGPLKPGKPGRFYPSIRIESGAFKEGKGITVCYPCPSRLPAGSVYAVAHSELWRKSGDLLAIWEALAIMDKIWTAVLAANGAEDDLGRQERFAKALVGPEEGAFALMRNAKVFGTKGIPKKAEDVLRNVLALAYWGYVRKFREGDKGVYSDGRPVAGVLHWEAAAGILNGIFRHHFKNPESWGYVPFTGDSLKSFAKNYGLEYKAVR